MSKINLKTIKKYIILIYLKKKNLKTNIITLPNTLYRCFRAENKLTRNLN
jgi:hypothetical protein